MLQAALFFGGEGHADRPSVRSSSSVVCLAGCCSGRSYRGVWWSAIGAVPQLSGGGGTRTRGRPSVLAIAHRRRRLRRGRFRRFDGFVPAGIHSDRGDSRFSGRWKPGFGSRWRIICGFMRTSFQDFGALRGLRAVRWGFEIENKRRCQNSIFDTASLMCVRKMQGVDVCDRGRIPIAMPQIAYDDTPSENVAAGVSGSSLGWGESVNATLPRAPQPAPV